MYPNPQQGQPVQPAPASGSAPGGDMAQMVQQQIDPNNPLQTLLLKRIDQLSPQEGAALAAMGPEAGEALKKILPEVAFMIDMVVLGRAPGGAPSAPAMPPGPGAGAPMPPGGAMPPAPGAQPVPQEASKAGRLQALRG